MKRKLLAAFLLATGLAGAQITIGTGTAIDGNSGLTTPISNWYNTSLSQFIYLASEINASGNITSVQFKLNNANTLANSNDQLNVWVGHTTKSGYTPVISPTGADWIPVAAHTQVMTNGSLTMAGTTATFTFAVPFVYNGTDNLVITVDANEPLNDGSNPLWLQSPTPNNVRCLMIRTDEPASNADPLNPPLNYSGAVETISVQAKTTRPIITINGLAPLGINHNDIASLSVYPNPVRSDLYFETAVEISEIAVYNVTGKRMVVEIEAGKVAVDVLPTGVYFLKGMLADGKSFVTKFIKE